MTDVIVLGAGIVGVSAAIHLQRRGRRVLLLDRNAPGQETSYGNAGIIQAEGIRPRAFPRGLGELLKTARGGGLDVRYDARALPRLVSPFLQYWWNSAPARYERIVADYAPLIALALDDHADLIAASGASHLVRRNGWMLIYRTEAARDTAFALADTHYPAHGIGYEKLDAAGLLRREPDLADTRVGALHWTDPWTITDPGGLVAAYALLFERLGGTIERAGITAIEQRGSGWLVRAGSQTHEAAELVLALGPWSGELLRPLGYRFPLFAKRGYHMHYGLKEGRQLNNWLLDIEVGYLASPMDQGIRLTTGAEFAAPGSPPNPVQLDGVEAVARRLLPLTSRLEPTPWMGSRPCTPDMKPIIGAAPNHKGLWLAFGHAHHGFTLGPSTGRLLAQLMTGEPSAVPLAPFAPHRFMR
jgi:D-amino-acid dehydrogenase